MPETTPSIPTFADYVQDRKYTKNVSPKTLAWYKDVERVFGSVDIHNIRPSLRQLIQAQLEKGNKPVSVNSWLTGIRAYLMWLHNEGFLKEKPRVELLKFEQKVIATFTTAQVEKLLAFKPASATTRRTHAATCLLLDSGLRVAEMVALSPADVDFENLLLKVHGKGNKQRIVPMSFELRKRLWQYQMKAARNSHGLGDVRYFFGTRTNTRVTVRNFQRDFKVLGKQLGIVGVRMSPHTLRHTFAVNYLRAGGNLFYLSKILGHTSITTTQRYLQSLGIEDLQAVHNKLSLLSHSEAGR